MMHVEKLALSSLLQSSSPRFVVSSRKFAEGDVSPNVLYEF